MPCALLMANTKTTVTQVSTAITVSDDVDYIITSETPFVEGGSINITNLEHAVIIVQNVRPSAFISSWLGKYVQINGAKAVNKSNCQVRMYAQGAIILPYSNGIKPLTVYSGQNFTGTSVNSFGLENTGGFMNTLTEEKLNNKIRSFKLKRGYMVTFSTRASGRGYSRCFIADQEDLEIATLPTVLDQTITSYRVFQWYNAPKKGLGSDTRADANAKLNSSWCYDWGTGHDLLPDVECVPNHIYEDYPSPSSCGGVTYSCHLKTNNEPGNSADDHPQDVATVLANWENLMRTGLRLCSESSHDGSMSHLKAFIDSIDARGWRCDILDLHCYWPSGTFNNLTWYSDHYGNGRPIWISEWVWGASWNNNGAFAVSNRGDFKGNWANTYNGTKPILDVLNSNSRVERYAYWNSEAECSRLLNGSAPYELSTLGEYYAKMNTGLGYNPANEFIPKNPRQYDPSGLQGKYDDTKGEINLSWTDQNGEYNQWMVVQEKKAGTNTWTDIQQVELKEDGGKYSISLSAGNGNRYRISLKDLNGTVRTSKEVSAVSQSIEPGDRVSIDGKELYVGGNLLPNGDFELGLYGWMNGTGQQIAHPYFQVVPVGGIDGGAYLQCYGGSSDKTSAECIRQDLKVMPDSYYYASATGCYNNPSYQRISFSSMASLEVAPYAVQLQNVTAWATSGAPVKVNNDTICHIWFRNCAGTAQIDNVFVARMFETQEEALADALVCARQRAELFAQYCTDNITNDWLAQQVQQATTHTEVEAAIQTALSALKAHVNEQDVYTAWQLGLCSDDVNAAMSSESALPTDILLRQALADSVVSAVFKYTTSNTGITQPNFATADGWSMSGTYTAGDQRLATQAGKSCWNAWWNIAASGNEKQTMAVSQNITGLSAGLYALECKATTEHLCETDQHAYMTNRTTGQTVRSQQLPYGVLDLPSFKDADKWCTLVTNYLIVQEGDELEIGFCGSKAGAVDKSWIKYGSPTSTGDRREGWWCATDFTFRQIPIHVGHTDDSQWGTICLPYAFSVNDNVKIYQVAGILSDRSAICLEEATEIKAGYPYVYHIDGDTISYFFETITAKPASAKTNVNGLRGTVTANARSQYEVGNIVLRNGVWTRLTQSEPLPNYTAYIRLSTNLPVLASWDGVSLPTSGCEEIELNALDRVTSSASQSGTFNLVGQKGQAQGLIIRQGKVIFVK